MNAEGSNATLKPDDGETIRMAPTETVTARTTVIARSGQSVVVGSQLTKRQARQSELLIVVTPELLGKDAAPR